MQSPHLPLWLGPVQPHCFPARQSSTSKDMEALDRAPGRAGRVLGSSTNYNSRRGPAVPDLASTSGSLRIHTSTQASFSRRVVRPLPAIPSTPSPSSSPLSSPRSFRPLPSPPSSSPPSATSFRSLDAELATMTVSPVPEIIEHPPVPQHLTQPRPTLSTLVTNLDSLKLPESDTASHSSPLSPQMPTPQTAKRKRMAKLRRHLGEPILDEAVYARRVSVTAVTAQTKGNALQEVEQLGGRLTYLRAAITVGKILDMSSDDESDEEDESEGKDEAVQEEYTWALENGVVFRGVSERRYSRKWMHEKRGQRWEESNYEVVLQALRSL